MEFAKYKQRGQMAQEELRLPNSPAAQVLCLVLSSACQKIPTANICTSGEGKRGSGEGQGNAVSLICFSGGRKAARRRQGWLVGAVNVRSVFSSGGHSVYHKLEHQHQPAPEHHRALESLRNQTGAAPQHSYRPLSTCPAPWRTLSCTAFELGAPPAQELPAPGAGCWGMDSCGWEWQKAAE